MSRQQVFQDIELDEQGDTLRFGNSELGLEFSRNSGAWTALRCGCGSTRIEGSGPTLLLSVGGRMRHTAAVRVDELVGGETVGLSSRYGSHTVRSEEGAVALEVTTEDGAWRLTSLFRLRPRCTTIQRDLRLEYRGRGEALLREVELLLPTVIPGDASSVVIEAPGYAVPSHYPLQKVPVGEWAGLKCWSFAGAEGVNHAMDAPGSMPGLIALHDPRVKWSVMCWPFSTNEPAWAAVRREGSGVVLGHRIQFADRFRAGGILEAGTQYIRVSRGSWDEALRSHQDWYEEVTLSAPSDGPSWGRGVSIYEVHVGKAPFPEGRDYEPYGTVEDIRRDLSRIKALGFEVIQLMPHWPFPGYSVHDFLDIDATYGSEAELKDLVGTAHGMGLRVILDVVLHGCLDKEIVEWDQSQYGFRGALFARWLELARARSPYRDEHPEWFQREEEGEIARVYTWAFDPANRSFQDFVIQVAREYVDRLGIDGFRFDAPTWNTFPNWDRGLPYRASASLYGAYELFVRMREAFKAEGLRPLLFTEPSGPLFRGCMDLTYNYDEEWISGSLMDVVSRRGYAGAGIYDGSRLDARKLAEWLQHRQMVLPRGEATVHHLDSHDTFWWGGKAQFRREAFGAPAARALFAFFALLGGGIMVYTGAERGDEELYARILGLRQRTPVLRYGRCDFGAVRSSEPSVLAFLRAWEGDRALAVVNFSSLEVEAEVSVSLDAVHSTGAAATSVHDLLDPSFAAQGRTDVADALRARQPAAIYRIDLPPHGARILRIGQGVAH